MLRTFKNKQSGDIVSWDVQSLNTQARALFKSLVELGEDWKEITELVKPATKSYEILSFVDVSGDSFDGKLLTKRENGGYHWEYLGDRVEGRGTAENYLKHGAYKINSVRRLNDDQIFTLDERLKEGQITSFEVKNGVCVVTINDILNARLEDVEQILYITEDGVERYKFQTEHWVIHESYAYELMMSKGHLELLKDYKTYKIFSTKEAAEEYVKSLNPALFTTEDGVTISKGDIFYNVSPQFKIDEFQVTNDKYELIFLGDGSKQFSSKERAKEYCLMNKPCLSLQDLLHTWGTCGTQEFYAQSPLFQDFKKLAAKKVRNS